MKTRLRATLRLIFLVFALVPAITLLAVGYWSLSDFALKTVTEQLGVLSYSTTAAIENVLSYYKTELVASSEMASVEQTALGMYKEAKKGVDSYIASTVAAEPDILDIVITDINGAIVADYAGKELGTLFSAYTSETTELSPYEIYLSDIFIENSDYERESVFYLTTPVLSEDSITGYVSFVISANAFTSIPSETNTTYSPKVMVMDRKGNVAEIGENTVTRFEEISDSKFQSFAEKIRTEINNSNVEYENFAAGKYIGVYNNINGYEWHWLGIYPTAGISSIYSGYYLIGVISLIILMGAIAVVTIQLSNMTISPMHEMIATMDLLNNGNLDARFQMTGKNEYSQMSDTFNSLIDEVLISEELHHTISNISDNILFEWDFHKEQMFVSENFPPLFNIDTGKATLLNGRFIDSLMETEEAEKYKRDINKLIKTKSKLVSEYQILTKKNNRIWFSVRAQCVLDRTDELLRVVGVITNIDSEKKLTLQLSERASYDFLSKLYNRNTFMRELDAELIRDASAKHAIAFIDVDDFKNINDQYGHAAGDSIIKHVSGVIKSELKNTGFAGRFGGDEFVMCINDPKAVENVEKMVSQLIDIYNEGYYSEEHNLKIKIKISIGIAKFPEHGRSGEMLIAAADEAMYFVKKHGKSNYHVYNPKDSNLSDMMRTL